MTSDRGTVLCCVACAVVQVLVIAFCCAPAWSSESVSSWPNGFPEIVVPEPHAAQMLARYPGTVPSQASWLQLSSASESADDQGVMPEGLLFQPYSAAPHEPGMNSVLKYDLSKDEWRWDSTLGGRVGIYRQNYPLLLALDAWQIDVEGASIYRLNPELDMDVESYDVRFGVLWAGRRDQLAFKFGYFHLSSHLGDELLFHDPTVERIHFVRESLVFGTSLQATPKWRLYGEAAWAFAVRGGAKPMHFQFGTEYLAIPFSPRRGAPFTSVNLQLRQESNYAAGVTIMSGWQWTGAKSARTLRLGAHYFNGPSNQYAFFNRFDNQVGAGLWLDF